MLLCICLLLQQLCLAKANFEIKMDTNPLENISEQFSQQHIKLYSLKNRKSKFKTYIEVSTKDEQRKEILTEFLAQKILQYSDKISLMTIPEYRKLYSEIKVIKNEPNLYQPSAKFGSTSCHLDQIANSSLLWQIECPNIFKIGTKKCRKLKTEIEMENIGVPIPICPWHWNIITREDRFPFKISNAVCNCLNCQAKTIYDTKRRKVSSCLPDYVLMPVLVRSSVLDSLEKWRFYMEEVPSSCSCTLNQLKPILM